MPILCDNTGVTSLSKYIVHDSRDKHIDIKYYFICDHVDDGNFVLNFIDS